MTWFRADDGLPDHPKVLELADTRSYKAAMGLWVLAGCWSSKHLTDGAVPKGVVKRLGFTLSEAKALVECGLWSVTETGYQFHDWAQCNPLRAEVEAKREATAARVKRHRNKPNPPDCNAPGNALHGPLGNGVSNDAPDPTRPDPTGSVSASARQEFADAHRAWAFDRGRDPETLTGKALDAATERALAVAQRLDLSLAQAAGLLCDAALRLQQSTGKPWAYALREAQPKRGPAPLSQADFAADLAALEGGAA